MDHVGKENWTETKTTGDKMKHIFQPKPNYLITKWCHKCGFGIKNYRHLHPSIPLLIHWLLGEKQW
jgi:hypothetical protein